MTPGIRITMTMDRRLSSEGDGGLVSIPAGDFVEGSAVIAADSVVSTAAGLVVGFMVVVDSTAVEDLEGTAVEGLAALAAGGTGAAVDTGKPGTDKSPA